MRSDAGKENPVGVEVDVDIADESGIRRPVERTQRSAGANRREHSDLVVPPRALDTRVTLPIVRESEWISPARYTGSTPPLHDEQRIEVKKGIGEQHISP